MKQNYRNYCLVLVVLFGSLLQIHCGGFIKTPRYPAEVTPELQRAFKTAEQLYSAHQFAQALEHYRKITQNFPHTALTDEALYKIGKINFLQTKMDFAIQAFRELAEKTPDPKYRAKAYLMVGYAEYKLENWPAATTALQKVESKELPLKLQIRGYSLMLLVAEKNMGSGIDADYALLRLADVYHESLDQSVDQLSAQDILTKVDVIRRLENWVVKPIPENRISSWFRNYPEGFAKPFVEYKWGKIFFEAGNQGRAKSQLTRYLQSYPKHDYAMSAEKMLTQLGATVDVKAVAGELRVGVLLPLTGPQSGFGQAALMGIQCAAGQIPACQKNISQLESSPVSIRLIVKDTQNDPALMEGLINELAGENVSAIIGPLSSNLAEVAAERAQQIHIPLFPITQKVGLMDVGRYVFQMGYELDQQVRDIVRIALGREINTFGLFYPDNNYGKKLAETFRAEVEKQGGKINADKAFNPASTDLAGQARALKLAIRRFSYEGKTSGFQALFIPDSYWTVKRLVPALRFVTIKDIPLIGTNAWNDPSLTSADLEAFPGSFFVDLFYPGDTSELVTQFSAGMKSSQGKAPSSLEALGFDAVWFIRQGYKKAGSDKPSAIMDALRSMLHLEGVTGIRSFASGPEIKPFVLTVDETGIVLAP